MTNFRPDRSEVMSPTHLARVRKLPSCVSGRTPCEAHHLQVSAARGVGMKATDRWAVPLTHDEHMELHTFGSKREREWFAANHVPDPYSLARGLWAASGDETEMLRAIAKHRTI